MIKIEIRIPTYASILTFVKIYIIADIKTEDERIASLVASEPDATSEGELNFYPLFFTYFPSKSFNIIETINIIKVIFEYSTSTGLKIFLIDSIKEVIPA